jgi:hypothetical protein
VSLYTTRVWLRIKITRRFDCASSKFGWYADGNAEARTKGYFSESNVYFIEKITSRPGSVVEETAREIDSTLIGNVSVEVVRVSRLQLDEHARQIAELEKQLAEAKAGAAPVQHYSDCATNNAPALDPGPCDCGGMPTIPEGFTPHTGGHCPWNGWSLAEFVFRDGSCGSGDPHEQRWMWSDRPTDKHDVIASRLIAPPHNLPGYGPIKAGPPHADLKEFAVFSSGAWHTGYYAQAWPEATAHAMRGE